MPWFVAQACQGLIRLLHQRETASFVRVALKSAPRPNSVTALTATGARQTLEQEAYEKALLERKFPMFRPGDVVEVKLVRCPPYMSPTGYSQQWFPRLYTLAYSRQRPRKLSKTRLCFKLVLRLQLALLPVLVQGIHTPVRCRLSSPCGAWPVHVCGVSTRGAPAGGAREPTPHDLGARHRHSHPQPRHPHLLPAAEQHHRRRQHRARLPAVRACRPAPAQGAMRWHACMACRACRCCGGPVDGCRACALVPSKLASLCSVTECCHMRSAEAGMPRMHAMQTCCQARAASGLSECPGELQQACERRARLAAGSARPYRSCGWCRSSA